METQTALLQTLQGLKSQIEALEAQVSAMQKPAGKSPATKEPKVLSREAKREQNRTANRQINGLRGEATKQAKAGDLKKARAAISKANRIATERGWSDYIARNNQHLAVLVGE